MTARRLIVLACAAALATPATALAGFSSTTLEVSGPQTINVFPQTATDARGQSVVVWTERSATASVLRARRVRPDGTMGAPVDVSDGTLIVSGRTVVMAPDGRALVAWTESATGAAPLSVRARWLEPDDSMGPQVAVLDAGATATAGNLQATATSDGDAVLAWRDDRSTPTNGFVEARRVDAGGGLGPLLQPAQGANLGGTLDVAPDDAAGVVWRAPPGFASMPVTAGGAAGTVRTPVANGVLGGPRLTAGPPGSFRLTWVAQGPPDSVATVALDASGQASGGVTTVDPAGLSGSAFFAGANAAGRALVIAGHTSAVVGVRGVAPDGTPLGTVFTAPAEQQFAAQAAVLGDGAGLAFWFQGPPAGLRALVTRTFAPDGTAGAAQALGPAVDSSSFDATPAGVGLVAWQQRLDDAGTLAVRARQHLPAPACSDAAATVVQGAPAVVALSCAGLQLSAIEVVTKPAHGSLGAVDTARGNVVYTPVPGFDGQDSFTFRAVNPGGAGAVHTALIRVGRDTMKPQVRRFLITLRTIRLHAAYKRPKAKRPAFRLILSEPATARVAIQRKRGGKRFVPFRVVRTRIPATTARIPLAKKRLAPGSYRATVVVTDAAGNASAARRIGFIVRR